LDDVQNLRIVPNRAWLEICHVPCGDKKTMKINISHLHYYVHDIFWPKNSCLLAHDPRGITYQGVCISTHMVPNFLSHDDTHHPIQTHTINIKIINNNNSYCGWNLWMITSRSDAPWSTILLVAIRKYIRHLWCKENINPGFSFFFNKKKTVLLKIWWFFSQV
jgi:hypothetical protein